MQFGLRLNGRSFRQLRFQIGTASNRFAIPVDDAVGVDINLDDHRVYLFSRWRGHRHVQIHGVKLRWNGDDQHDQEHQHHVNQWRGVDLHHHFWFFTRTGAYVHSHGLVPLLRLSDEANLGDAGALHRIHHPPHRLKVALAIAPNLNFRLRCHDRKLLHALQQVV